MARRKVIVNRETGETRMKLELTIDGSGRCGSKTGVGMLDHQAARAALSVSESSKDLPQRLAKRSTNLITVASHEEHPRTHDNNLPLLCAAKNEWHPACEQTRLPQRAA